MISRQFNPCSVEGCAHGAGQRVTDKVSWCVEFLKNYPEILKAQGFSLIESSNQKTATIYSISDAVNGMLAIAA